jgi:microcystin-dependent protein
MKPIQRLKFLKAILVLLISGHWAMGQVGINTNSPHPSAALEIKSDTAGLLIPRITTTARESMSTPGNSLLVYDTDLRMYFYYQASDSKWYVLNTWITTVVSNSKGGFDTISFTNGKVGIGTNNPSESLQVIGNIKANGNVVATSSVTAPKLYGEGATPAGSIVMWSGNPSTLPVGWALCDGSVINLPQGGTYTTPNLKGRFVVGYDPNDTDYNNTNKVGPVYTDADGNSNGTNTTDAKQIRLKDTQSGLPVHSHTATDKGHSHPFSDWYQQDKTVGKNAGGGEDAASNGETSRDTNTGVGKADIQIGDSDSNKHAVESLENRPPYYVLAYIIKLPY